MAYLFFPGFYDHGEAQVANLAANWSSGGEIYHPVDAAVRFSTLYGPVPMILAGIFLSLVSATWLAAKLSGVLALVASLVGFFTTLRSYAREKSLAFGGSALGLGSCVFGLGIFVLMLLGFDNYSYWIRPDSVLLAIVVLAILLAVKIRSVALLLALEGCLAGLGMNSKIYAPIFFLPVFFFWLEARKPRLRWWHLLPALAGFAVGMVGPFLLPRVSPQAFVDLVSMGLHQQLIIANGIKNLSYALPAFVLLMFLKFHERHRWTVVTLFFSMVVVAVFSAKPGSGVHLFLPLMAIMFFLVFAAYVAASAALRVKANVAFAAFALVLAVHAVKHQRDEINGLKQFTQRQREFEDLQKLVAGESGPIELGYADDARYEMSFYKPWLVSSGHGLFVDAAGFMEMTFSGFETLESTYETLASCRIPLFVLPKGDASWKLANWYFKGVTLFSDRWRSVFSEHYQVVKSSEFYDLYRCQPVLPQ